MSRGTETAITPGFLAPVSDAQTVFRAVLNACAHPTTRQQISVELAPPRPMEAALAAIILCLCDDRTPVWLDRTLSAQSAVADWIRFHTGAPIVPGAGDAEFVVASSLRSIPPWEGLRRGTDCDPHTTATVLVDVTADVQPAMALRASGPGIQGTRQWTDHSLSREFVTRRAVACGDFPCGIDLVVTAAASIYALPRTTVLDILPGPGADDISDSSEGNR